LTSKCLPYLITQGFRAELSNHNVFLVGGSSGPWGLKIMMSYLGHRNWRAIDPWAQTHGPLNYNLERTLPSSKQPGLVGYQKGFPNRGIL